MEGFLTNLFWCFFLFIVASIIVHDRDRKARAKKAEEAAAERNLKRLRGEDTPTTQIEQAQQTAKQPTAVPPAEDKP